MLTSFRELTVCPWYQGRPLRCPKTLVNLLVHTGKGIFLTTVWPWNFIKKKILPPLTYAPRAKGLASIQDFPKIYLFVARLLRAVSYKTGTYFPGLSFFAVLIWVLVKEDGALFPALFFCMGPHLPQPHWMGNSTRTTHISFVSCFVLGTSPGPQ